MATALTLLRRSIERDSTNLLEQYRHLKNDGIENLCERIEELLVNYQRKVEETLYKNWFQDLSDEIVYHIFACLPPNEVYHTLPFVCRRFRCISRDRTLWKQVGWGWSNLHHLHCTKQSGIAKDGWEEQQFINSEVHRPVVVEWLIDVAAKLLGNRTLFLGIKLLDEFIHSKSQREEMILKKDIQLVGIIALKIASSLMGDCELDVRFCEYITARTYTPTEFLEMEAEMRKTLEGSIKIAKSTVTTADFIRPYYSQLRKLVAKDVINVAQYASEASLLAVEMDQYCPSMIAAAAIYVGLEYIVKSKFPSGEVPWSIMLQEFSCYTYEEILPCVTVLKQSITKHQKSKHKTLKKKYNISTSIVRECDIDEAQTLLEGQS